MKPIAVLLAIILYLVVVSGRNIHDVDTENEDNDSGYQEKRVRDHTNSQMRHRRRARHSNYNDYYNPYNPYDDYFDRRRDDKRDYYNRHQEELLSRILNQIEEISVYIKKTQTPPPPPSQIIYVPIIYPVPQDLNNTKPIVPDLGNRFSGDRNQNWGIIPGNLGKDNDDGSDGSRPINLKPVQSNDNEAKPPPVEHGSSQAGMTTAKPSIDSSEPGRCKAAILVCCQTTNDLEKQQCFSNYGCSKTYYFARSCQPNIVKAVIAEFAKAYGPINYT